MHRWQRQTVTIACGDGETVTGSETIDADVLGALAVHRTTQMPWTMARWSITHVPTGRHVATANTERLARRFVREVLPLLDWERTDLRGRFAPVWGAMHAAMLRAHDGRYISEVRL